jgi:hypothetical protein
MILERGQWKKPALYQQRRRRITGPILFVLERDDTKEQPQLEEKLF